MRKDTRLSPFSIFKGIAGEPGYELVSRIDRLEETLKELSFFIARDKAGKETATISAYNEKTDSWETMADMPTARHHALVAIVSEKMMVIGGWNKQPSCFCIHTI